MKLIRLKNVSGKRRTYPVRAADGTQLVLDPGESKPVTPATEKHPAVSRHIGKELEVERDVEETKAKEPVTPAPPQTPPAAPTQDNEPDEDETEEESPEPADQPAGDDLSELYVSAPGITESNVKKVMNKFPTVEDLALASRSALKKVGVANSYTTRLLDWAEEQL